MTALPWAAPASATSEAPPEGLGGPPRWPVALAHFTRVARCLQLLASGPAPALRDAVCERNPWIRPVGPLALTAELVPESPPSAPPPWWRVVTDIPLDRRWHAQYAVFNLGPTAAYGLRLRMRPDTGLVCYAGCYATGTPADGEAILEFGARDRWSDLAGARAATRLHQALAGVVQWFADGGIAIPVRFPALTAASTFPNLA